MKRMTALLMLLAAAACGDAAGPADTPDPTFSLQASGDLEATVVGRAFYSTIASGYAIVDPQTGQRTETDVTSILLTPNGLGASVHIGLLGQPVVGTYHVQDNNMIGERPEYYASYDLPASDGGRWSYSASVGTVTITAVSPRIVGTFAFQSRYVSRWPRDPQVGTQIRPEPASLSVTGRFTAAPWDARRLAF